MTEREKMENGLWYDANFDSELLAERLRADDLCFDLNNTRPSDTERREQILKELLPDLGENATILSPFNADYGWNCTIGSNTYINRNAYLMDCAPIKIGNHCFIGPNCGMYTAIHPTVPEERNKGLETAKPITIGDNVWFGGDVTVLPGVTIGEGSIIGAKSLVSKDIPPGVLAAGNPCRVIRSLDDADRISDEFGR